MPNYFDNWQAEGFACSGCGWRGLGSMLRDGDFVGWEGVERLCPRCGKYVTLLSFPTLAECRANWDKLSDTMRRGVEKAERHEAEFERRKLTESSPLPTIDEPSFALQWDFLDDGVSADTLITFADTILFSEPAFYEGYGRFIEVATILRARYGAALIDLVPTHASELYLYGDRFASLGAVSRARAEIFSQRRSDH